MPKSLFNLLQVSAIGLAVMISFSSLRVKSDDYELQATVQTPDIAYESETDIGLWARFHFAIHTEDFDSTREFYRRLGFTQGITGFPLTNTHAMARALGMFDLCQYELEKGEVLLFPGADNTTGIDLLQWRVPFNPEPPYDKPNHLGMAYATLMTGDLMSDYALLKNQGVEFISEPYGAPGKPFYVHARPDGIYLKLEEAHPATAEIPQQTQIMGMPYIGINVSDVEASVAFTVALATPTSAGLTSKPLPKGVRGMGLRAARHLSGR